MTILIKERFTAFLQYMYVCLNIPEFFSVIILYYCHCNLLQVLEIIGFYYRKKDFVKYSKSYET